MPANNRKSRRNWNPCWLSWQEDAFHPLLKTHKLKGRLAGSWACSAGCDLRMVFQFVKHKGEAAILLEGLGTHDEVY